MLVLVYDYALFRWRIDLLLNDVPGVSITAVGVRTVSIETLPYIDARGRSTFHEPHVEKRFLQ